MKFTLIFLTCLCAFHQLAAKEREFSDVTITQANDDDASTFANILLDTLVEKSIVDESTACKILATFKVNGVNRKATQAFLKATISALDIKGDDDASRKFVKRLKKLLDQPAEQGVHLIEHLLELVLDNDLMEAKAGAELAAENGYGAKVQTTRFTSSTQDVEAAPQSTCKACCAKSLAPLMLIGEDGYPKHRSFLADVTRADWGLPLRVRKIVAYIATTPKSCDCDGIKLEPIHYTYKNLGGNNYDRRWTKLADATKNTQSGFTSAGVVFYCANVQGQCGATEPLRRYYVAGDQATVLTISPEEGSKLVAAGAKDEGVLCYVWPLPSPVQQ